MMQPESSGSQQESYREVDPTTVKTKDQLLALVLSETLSRRREDPSEMIQSLRVWRATLADVSFGQSLCENLVGQVLKYRFGPGAAELPDRLRIEVSSVLWNDPTSRSRIERLWIAVGTIP